MTEASLIPPSPEPTQHQVEIIAKVGPCGGPTRRYRGAIIESNEKGTLFPFFLEGHPHHGTTRGNWENLIPCIDLWLDHRTLPPPYRVPANHPRS